MDQHHSSLVPLLKPRGHVQLRLDKTHILTGACAHRDMLHYHTVSHVPRIECDVHWTYLKYKSVCVDVDVHPSGLGLHFTVTMFFSHKNLDKSLLLLIFPSSIHRLNTKHIEKISHAVWFHQLPVLNS